MKIHSLQMRRASGSGTGRLPGHPCGHLSSHLVPPPSSCCHRQHSEDMGGRRGLGGCGSGLSPSGVPFCTSPGARPSPARCGGLLRQGTAAGQCFAGRTGALGSRGVCYLGIAAITWGMVTQVEAWTYSYSDPGLYSWEQARNYCRTFFTDLVAIQNKEEIAYLNATLPFLRQYYWIGIRKQGGVWTWVGTNKVLTKEAENWARGEPNNRRSNQDCVEIYIKRQQEAGKWNDEPCNKKKTALCYKASCQASTCRPHGECVEVIKSYRCECHPGFEGDDCSIAVQCPTLDAQEALMTCSHPFGDFRYNSTCDFGCPEGFERRGEGTLRCLASRQWSAETPTCAAVACPELAAPESGRVNCSHPHGASAFSSTCDFSCQEGFEVTGPERLWCTAEGAWSGAPPHCKAITCPVLRAPEHGEMNCSHLHDNFSFGSTCAFSCQAGFELMGTESHECTAMGTWSGDTPQCKAITCPVLRAPEHGEMSCSHLHDNFSFSSTCNFSCHPGFELIGPESSACTAMGTWSGDTPQCKAITCPVLRAPEHGEMNCSHLHENFSFSSTCAFSCQPGFERMGPESRECTAMGTWSGDAPQCKAITCPVLRAPDHGEMSCSHLHGNFSFSSTCAFLCQPGFELIGPESRECTAMGTWSGETPQCKAITCPMRRAPEHGEMNCSHLHDNFSFNSTCNFSCHPGFELIGPESSACTAMGTWSGDTPQCKAITCPVLRAPEHGRMDCSHLHDNFSFNSTCEFSCQPGFELIGPESHECTAMGTWSGDIPQCKAITCPMLRAPEHGRMNCSHLYGSFTFTSTCAFSCQPGFELKGSQSRVCMAMRTWTGDTPRCRAISCPVLEPPSRGHLNCSHLHGNFTYNSTCAFSCEDGFVRMGARLLRCQATGNWTSHSPVCKEDAAPFLKQVLVYTSSSALVVAGVVLSGTLLALLAKRLSDREEKKKLLNPTSDLGSPGIFTNAAYDSNL
ncbi:P-selectin isoform X4 [Anas platyrhynchos]|uniref:P-selectin isoform X4 n=1 Tax=Anas platyrhynchos TaxID=8839 RepID=UPI003AF2FE48